MADVDVDPGFARWAHLEIMGHRDHFGSCSETVIAGSPMLQIEIFALGDEAPRTVHIYGGPAIFCITPCAEAAARLASTPWSERPRPAELDPADIVDATIEDDEDEDEDFLGPTPL